jgi:hypothetical protein
LCAAPSPRRASASSPPLPHPPEVVSDAVTYRVRASVGLEALDAQTQALGACPRVRALKPALVGEQRVVHLPERVLRRRRLGRRPPGRAKAGRRRCRDIDQLGCRLRLRDLREAGVSEVLRQLPQFAEGEPRSPILDAGPLHMHHRPRAASSRRQRPYGLCETHSSRLGPPHTGTHSALSVTRKGPPACPMVKRQPTGRSREEDARRS